MDTTNTTFGTAVIKEYSAKDVVNPPKSYEEVFKEGNEGHDLYVVSHNDYYAGEAKNRKYNPSSFHRCSVYGVPTPHFNDGRAMAKSLYWLHELQMKRGAKFVSKRADDFKEKFQHKLGRVLDPIAETMNVPPDCTFGACLRPEEYGVGDLIHNRLPDEYLRGKDRQRALIAAVRHHLKKVNYQKFDTLLAAFRHYDKKGDGMIDKDELQEACDQANLSLDDKLLDQLFDYCDVDNDGFINYLEFANFLNWKDKMLLKEYEERVIIKGRKPDCVNPTEANVEEPEQTLLIKPEDIVLKEAGSTEKTLRTLLRPSDKVSNYYKTTSSEINAIVTPFVVFQPFDLTFLLPEFVASVTELIMVKKVVHIHYYILPFLPGKECLKETSSRPDQKKRLQRYCVTLVSNCLMKNLKMYGILHQKSITEEKFVLRTSEMF
eukprot:XP_016861234.1 EF-hand domain-containing family member B isoform X7 [Homo sapiens]